MQFKTIQDQNTKKIIMYFVDNKRVTRDKFLHLGHIQWLKGRKYNCSQTNRTKNNNLDT